MQASGILVLVVVVMILVVWFDPTFRRERQFKADLQRREQIPDEELFIRYFEGAAISPDMPACMRRVFAQEMDVPADKLLPNDDLAFHWDEIDAAPLVESLEKEFSMQFTKQELDMMPPTIRGMSEWVDGCRRARNIA